MTKPKIILMNKIEQLICRTECILHENCFLALFRSLIVSLLHRFFSLTRFDIYESTLDPPEIKCEVDNLTIRIITQEDELSKIESYLIADDIKISRDKKLLSMGAIMFCAFVGNELAHITYVFIGKKAHESYPLSFAMKYGHTTGLSGRTIPKYRRQGIHVYTRSKALKYLKENGFSRACDVQNGNIAARDSVLKLGYYFCGNGYRLKILSMFTIEWTKPKLQLASHSIKCSWSI